MDSETYRRASRIAEEAVALPLGRRAEFLAEQCGEDAALMRLAEGLLAGHLAPLPDLEHEPPLPPQTLGLGRERSQAGAPANGAHRPGDIVGGHRLLHRIGAGGMGQVWEAAHVKSQRRVALKLILPGRVNGESLARFARESAAGGRVNHPNIVTTYAAGNDDGVDWIAMELVEGARSMKDLLEETRDLQLVPTHYYKQIAELIARVAEGLHAAHRAGVVHRDIKPQNILLTDDGVPKVTDFGIAKLLDASLLTRTDVQPGTLAYMSPEQLRPGTPVVDPRTDVFSLGVVLYELLALRRPFEGDTPHQIERQIVEAEPADLRRIRSQVPRDLAVISGKCLEKDRERRYASMGDLARDLRCFCTHEPILATPPGRARRVLLWARRNPTKSVAAGVAALAFVAISWLLEENVRAKRNLEGLVGERDTAVRELKASNERLLEQSRLAENAAAEARAREAEVVQLAALQDLDELIARADELWPVHADRIPAYEAWIEEAEAEVARLPSFIEQRDELRLRALPQTPEERAAERATHPDLPRLQDLDARITTLQRALDQRRSGIQVPIPELDVLDLTLGPIDLNGLAWSMVDPSPLRPSRGEEPRGLALARRAQALAEGGTDRALVASIARTLACAYAALGRDAEARAAGERALAQGNESVDFRQPLEQALAATRDATSDGALEAAAHRIAVLDRERADLLTNLEQRRSWRFPDDDLGRVYRWWHANLTKVIAALEALRAPGVGLLAREPAAASPAHGWSVPRRLELARAVGARSVSGEEARARWREARDAIAISPLYNRLILQPRLGLLPIGVDPHSGLWEFAHLASGVAATRDESGRLLLTEATGVVLVLVPEGTFWQGAQRTGTENIFRKAQDHEWPVRQRRLSAFWIGKHEITQEQWQRLTGVNPSRWGPIDWTPGLNRGEVHQTSGHPVDQVDWTLARSVVQRFGLDLPTEAQWEYACLAGARTPWWTGPEAESLAVGPAANLADAHGYNTSGMGGGPYEAWLDDGATVHAPVGSYRANAFGLHDMHGNVWEWVRDGYDTHAYKRTPAVDPFVSPDGLPLRSLRGGGFDNIARDARAAVRAVQPPFAVLHNAGLRPVIDLL